jgi:23S rRNA pseudouridine1911/1915/1917 synthase
MLHAWQIEFNHPYSGQKFRFAVDPPKDFIRVAASLAHRVSDDSQKVWEQLISGRPV